MLTGDYKLVNNYKIMTNKFSKETITLWMNHLLVIYAFFIPISNRTTSTVFILILILFIYRRNYYYYLQNSFKNPLVISLCMLFLIHVIWLFGTQDFSSAARSFRDVEHALYPIIFLSFLDKKFALYIIGSFIMGMLFAEIVSYSISFGFLPKELVLFGSELYSSSQYDPSPFFNHTQYSTGLAITISLLIYNFATTKMGLTFNLISIFFITSATINLSIIGGRIGYLIFLVIVPLTFLLLYRKHFFKITLLVIFTISLISILAYNYSPIFKNRINQSIETIETLYDNSGDYRSSFGMRLGSWNYSIDVIKENWLFGVGTGDHMNELRGAIKTHKNLLNTLSHTHNQLISYMLQFGIFGLIISLYIAYQIFSYNYATTNQKNIAYIISVGIGVALLFGNFRSTFYLPVLATLLSACLTNKTYLINNDEKKITIIISYIIIIFLVSLNVIL